MEVVASFATRFSEAAHQCAVTLGIVEIPVAVDILFDLADILAGLIVGIPRWKVCFLINEFVFRRSLDGHVRVLFSV